MSDFNKNEMRVKLLNGSEILFRSADNPDRLRGPNASWWWSDESAYSDYKLFRVMLGRLRQFGRLGYLWLTTTPKGRNWIWKLFKQSPKAGYRLFTMPTWANPFLDEDIYRTWLDDYFGDFAAQELEGEFIAFQGLIYAEFERERFVTHKLASRYQYAVAGVDWGYNNPGVILVGGVDGDGTMTIIHEEYQRKRTIEDWAEVAAQLTQTYHIQNFWADPSEPDHIQKFADKGLSIHKADNSVTAGIQAVKARLNRRTLKLHHSAANTITEFEQYQWAEVEGGYQDRPLKANDHAMDALRYLIFNHDHKQASTIEIGVSRYA